MRLDHLLSREPSFVGNNQCAGLLVGVLVVFLCSHVFITVCWWWVWVRVWVGHKSLKRMSTLSGSRSTPCERPPVTVVACASGLGFCFLGVGVCGGLFVICIVVASIFVLYCFLCFV